LLVGYVSSDIFGERISKKHLRGLRGEMIKQRVQESFERAFNNVYFGVIAAAQDGKSEYKFAFVCKPDCYVDATKITFLREYQRVGEYITEEKYSQKMISSLRQTFLDASITRTDKECCNIIGLQW
jgi:hypothetical protein